MEKIFHKQYVCVKWCRPGENKRQFNIKSVGKAKQDATGTKIS